MVETGLKTASMPNYFDYPFAPRLLRLVKQRRIIYQSSGVGLAVRQRPSKQSRLVRHHRFKLPGLENDSRLQLAAIASGNCQNARSCPVLLLVLAMAIILLKKNTRRRVQLLQFNRRALICSTMGG